MPQTALESMLETQRAINKKAQKKKNVAGVALYPLGIERQYAAYLKSLVDFTSKQVRERLLPELSRFKAEALSNRADSIRNDFYANDIANIISGIRLLVNRREGGTIGRSEVTNMVGERVSKHNEEQFQAQFKRGLNVDIISRDKFLKQELESFAFLNSQLIEDLTTKQLDQVQRITISGLQTGTNTKDMAADIRKQTGMAKRRAELIARDQVSKLNGQLTELRQQEAGVKRYKWRTSKDERVRPSHAAREGVEFSWDDPPGDGHPGQPINCRCTAEPILDI